MGTPDCLFDNWCKGKFNFSARLALYNRFVFTTLVQMNQPFSIFHLTESDINLSASGIVENDAHTHDYEELIIGVEGHIQHFIDYKTVNLTSPFVSFVTNGKIHAIKPFAINGKCSIWALKFKSEFIPETTFQLYSYYHDQASLQISRNISIKRILAILQMMAEEMQQQDPDYAVVRHLLSALFTMLESERKKTRLDPAGLQPVQNDTFKKFLALLEQSFHEHEGVEFYADKLFMSARNLNLICHNTLQRSVTEIIELRKLIEAKNLLINTEKTISEIGFEVGFNEKTYFTSVFKKKSGQTPSEFRAEMKRLIS